jgi:hypothetical protein
MQYNLKDLSHRPTYDPKQLEDADEVIIEIINKDQVADDCSFFIGNDTISCTELLAKTPYKLPISRYDKQKFIDAFFVNNKGWSDTIQAGSKKNTNEHVFLGDRIWDHAIRLSNAINENNNSTIRKITSFYNQDYNSLRQANPFLAETLPLVLSSQDPDKGKTDEILNQSSGLDNLPKSNILLDAIAELVANRLVAELNQKYLQQFTQKLDSIEHLKTLLPETHQLLRSGATTIINYKTLLPSLRQSIFNDLNNLPNHLQLLLVEHRTDLFNNQPDQYVLTQLGLKLLAGIKDGENLSDIFGNLSTTNWKLEQDTSNIASWAALIGIISNHLRTGSLQTGKWIDEATFKNLTSNPQTVYLFLGLLLEKNKDKLQKLSIIGDKASTNVYDLITGKQFEPYATFALEVIHAFHEIAATSQQPNHPSLDQDNSKLISIAQSTLALLSKIPGHKKPTAASLPSSFVKILEDIYAKRYSSAVLELVKQIDPNSQNPALTTLLQYISFFQSLIDATTKEDMLSILEDAADPVGSYQHKRTSPFTVSITSFPALTFGRESFVPEINDDKWINNYGFTAPVGLAFSFSKKDTLTSSFSIMLPIIDVGAITSLRLQDNTATLPPVEWRNFIAPGAFLHWGLKNSPISIYGGVQYGPEAVKIDEQLETKVRLPRYNLGIAVDLHLFSIYNK